MYLAEAEQSLFGLWPLKDVGIGCKFAFMTSPGQLEERLVSQECIGCCERRMWDRPVSQEKGQPFRQGPGEYAKGPEEEAATSNPSSTTEHSQRVHLDRLAGSKEAQNPGNESI